ncbi:MAG: hypothetical protein IJZ92_05795 [Bacteroidaceae bacterium]|nr:hypothetical protein [Bacteroidaceae bacterium]
MAYNESHAEGQRMGGKVAGSTADLCQADDTAVSCRRYCSVMPKILQCQAVILQREAFSMLS